MDVAFIVDSSGSINERVFNDAKEIVKELVMILGIAPGKKSSSIGSV